MSISKYIYLFILAFNIHFVSYTQNKYPQNYFRLPVNIPISLSGSFAELRPGHFHSGIDIKTQGKEGLPIFAVADGYVSRIVVSPTGYGKALYITHPNGFVSVYAHLQNFNHRLSEFVKKAQYKSHKFKIGLYPPPNKFKVRKGEVIAYSGNSGSSMGPHLHFEIRDAKTEHPINPLLFHLDIDDTVKPKLYQIGIYPQDFFSFVNKNNGKRLLRVRGGSGKYYLSEKNIEVHGRIGFGIKVQDFVNNSYNRCGVYSIKLLVDGRRVYYHEMEQFSFYTTRYLNSLVDFEHRAIHRSWIQKSFVQPNNQLQIYKGVVNRGIVDFQDNKRHAIRYIIKDTYGNTSELRFNVKSISRDKLNIDVDKMEKPTCTKIMPYQQNNYYFSDDIQISFPPYSFYDTLCFHYTKTPQIPNVYSSIHYIHHYYEPVHRSYKVSIKPVGLPKKYRDKALIAAIYGNGKFSARGSEWENGFLTTYIRQFAGFGIVIDNQAPQIRPVNIRDGKNMRGERYLVLEIEDDLSGIKHYAGYIDNNWILFEYDAKKDKLTYDFRDKKISPGKHQFVLYVFDNKNNQNIYKAEFYR